MSRIEAPCPRKAHWSAHMKCAKCTMIVQRSSAAHSNTSSTIKSRLTGRRSCGWRCARQRFPRLPHRPPRPVEQSQQLSDRVMRLIRMAKRLIRSNSVAVLAAELFAFDEPGRLQIGDDPLHGPLGNSDSQCHLSKHDRRILRQEHQDVCVIGQKRPMGCSHSGERCVRRRCGNRTGSGPGPTCGERAART